MRLGRSLCVVAWVGLLGLAAGCMSSEKTKEAEATEAGSSSATTEVAPEPTAAPEGESSSCEKEPTPSVCCQALIPSCDACRDRNRRVATEWKRRCPAKTP